MLWAAQTVLASDIVYIGNASRGYSKRLVQKFGSRKTYACFFLYRSQSDRESPRLDHTVAFAVNAILFWLLSGQLHDSSQRRCKATVAVLAKPRPCALSSPCEFQ